MKKRSISLKQSGFLIAFTVLLFAITALPSLKPAYSIDKATDSGIMVYNSAQVSEKNLSQDDNKDKDKNKDKEAKKNLPNYKKYLDKTETLGVSSDSKILRAIHIMLNTQFYGTISEAKLTESTKSEIERLLSEVKINNPFAGENFNTSEEVLDFAQKKYNSQVPPELINYAAVCGMLRGVDDPYTIYMTPKEYGILMEQMQSQSFCGIGVYIELDPENNDALTVVEPIEGSPAFEAGLKTGDVITEIDGKTTKGLPIDISVAKMRGPKGTPIVLTISRKGTNGNLKFTINRDKIQVKSVSGKIIDNDIGYIKLRLFGAETNNELRNSLKDMVSKGIRGVILDLRNNGGGYINAAVDISSIFIDQGEPIVLVKNKSGNSTNHTSKGDFRLNLPLLVLVNKYSASASEITAGALKDYKRGILIGTKTFGKGSVQQVVPFSDGSAFKITISHYYTPKGNDIDKCGLEPDYKVEMDPRTVGKDKDAQLDKAIELIKSSTHSKN